jgi:ribosomal protein S18 acetylase RimI-like enzyme
VIRRLDPGADEDARRLVELQQASYRVEADLIGAADLPPLRDTVETLRASGETFWGVEGDGGRLAGAVAYKRLGAILDIHRMMVHPDWFRRGIAGRLLRFVETAESGVRTVVVSTGAANGPARALYEKHGFVTTAEREVEPGLLVVSLEKRVAGEG